MKVLCKACNHPNDLGHVFCMACGERLDLTNVDEDFERSQREAAKAAKIKLFFLTLVVLLLAFVGVCAWPHTSPLGDEKATRTGRRGRVDTLIKMANRFFDMPGDTRVNECRLDRHRFSSDGGVTRRAREWCRSTDSHPQPSK